MTGRPIADANVALVPTKDPPGVPHAGYLYAPGGTNRNGVDTDDSGHFRFANISPGVYRLEATADDYCDLEIPVGDPYRFDTPFKVGTEDRLLDATVRLYHCVEVRGRVTTPDGTPVPNVMIYLHPTDPGHEGSDDTKTDASGQYEFKELWTGEYIMEAVPPLQPGDHATALPISVRPGRLRVEDGDILEGVDFVLQPVPTGKLTVRMSASTELNPLDLSLEIRPILQDPTETAKSVFVNSRKQGSFEVSGVAPGKYFIRMETSLTDPPLAGGKIVEIDAQSNASEELRLLPVVKVSYVVRQLEGRQLPEHFCLNVDDAEGLRGPFGPFCPQAAAGPVSLPADVIYIATVAEKGLYLDSVLVNGQRQAASAIHLPTDARQANVEFILRTSGTILVKPAAGVEVGEISAILLLFDANGVPSGTIQGFFDDANHLKIDGIPPGRHRLLIYPADTPPCDLKRLNSCAGLGVWVTVQSARTLTVTAIPKKP